MALYTKKVAHNELVDSFMNRMDAAIETARGNGERSFYCHIPDDVLDDVRRNYGFRCVEVTPSHTTEGRTFYKVSGWNLW